MDIGMKFLAGKLLIAIPNLSDPNFNRSVVLITNHDEDGAMGVILNRPAESTVSDVWDEISPDLDCCDCTESIHIGGPVDGPLIALHTHMGWSDAEVFPGIYIAMSRQALNEIVMQDDHRFKIFSGYSGWSSGQLENEIEFGGWMTIDADVDHVFDSPERLWRRTCEHVGQEIMLPNLAKRSSGFDSSFN